jgi:mono/diheme cytochrome c family protein
MASPFTGVLRPALRRMRRLVWVSGAASLAAGALAQTAPPPPARASPQVALGAQLYQKTCALCHGVAGRDATVFPRPIWGPGHDIAKFGSAKGLFEYLQLLMPFDDPSKLDDAQKTAVVAYMLVRNGSLRPGVSLPTGGDPSPIR